MLEAWAKSHTVPFWWADVSRPVGSQILHNGTMVFLNTGERIIAVTAEHVYAGYLRDKQATQSFACQIGGASFEAEKRLIDADGTLDLATFDVSEILVSAAGATVHNPPKWPPDQLADQELTLLGGYPGIERGERPGEVDFGFSYFVSRVDQSSNDRCGVYLNIPEAHSSGSVVFPGSYDLGGASGGPVFRVLEKPVDHLVLAGFVYQYNHAYEIVFARHGNRINANGTLNR